MNLQIRDPRAHELAQRLAKRHGVSMTEAVIDALQSKLQFTEEQKAPDQRPLAERLEDIANRLMAKAGPNRRDMTKDEIDDMWGQP